MSDQIPSNLELLSDYLLKYGVNVIGAVVTLIAGYIVAGWVSRLIDGAMGKAGSLGDNAVNILFRVWTARTDWWDTKLDLVQRCKEGLEQGGCTIPFPQREVRVVQAPANPIQP